MTRDRDGNKLLEISCKEKVPRKETEFVLGNLDETTRLVATNHCFVIKKRGTRQDGNPGLWEPKWYYSDLKSALMGWYGKRALHEGVYVKEIQGDLKALIATIQALHKEVEVVGEKLDLAWARGDGGYEPWDARHAKKLNKSKAPHAEIAPGEEKGELNEDG